VIRAALRGSDTIVLQELLGGVRDRVVVAVTFLAMLELSKRREITLEQAEPWGPIVARRLTATVESESQIDESLGSFA
jgi:chromatin segregation and condensation protein Rec8/ScpA/Scc1 (kleisin family)